jgi:arabinofuranosyltransferase
MYHSNALPPHISAYRRLNTLSPSSIIWATAVVLIAIIFLRAWVCEDAYITFRVIDNFANGEGLRWNIHERVQVFTHPLWLLLHLPLREVWENLFYISTFLSVTCSAATIAVVLATIRQPLSITFGFFFVPFLMSKSVLDYTSSGLETPLCYLTFALFGYVVMRLREHRYFWFFLSLTVALSLFNRLDTAILFIPPLAWLLYSNWKTVRWDQLALGLTPLIAWFYFALLYYGFIFPNTKYAKLGTGMPLAQYLQQSFIYLKQLALFDTAGMLILVSSIIHLFRKNNLAASIALAVYAYFIYVLYIGGDYMAGRFWALPIFISIWLAYVFPMRLRPDVLFAVVCVLVASYFTSPMMRIINRNCSDCVVAKSRIVDARTTFHMNHLVGELYPFRIRNQGRYPFYREGIKIAQEMPPVKVLFYVGMSAYYGGSNTKFIDMLGLCDPLLSRLPAEKEQGFYIGHFRRNIPKGYEHAVVTGDLNEMHPALAQYYDKLRLIISGPLFSKERLKTIVLFNLGYYDKWKYEYIRSQNH